MSDVTDPSKRKLLQSVPLVAAASLLPSVLFSKSSSASSEPQGAGPSGAKVKKIALEEHFMLPEMIEYFRDTKINIRSDLYDKALPILQDFHDRRLAIMDANGVTYSVLSLSGPGVQVEKDAAKASRMANFCNDALAKEISKRPDRFGGFAHLAMQTPEAAANELERCVTQLGFKGALINGQTLGVYLDDLRYDVFWERVTSLDVPVYLHPGNPTDHPNMYADHPEMWGPTYSWAVETCAHAMRMIFSGMFDRHPKAKVILGHMGETLPIQLWRLDSRLPISNQKYELKKKPSEYVKSNILITTSGVCSDSALRCSIDALGIDNVMFSIDYPFEDTKTATDWIERAAISPTERDKIAFSNAQKLLKIKLPA